MHTLTYTHTQILQLTLSASNITHSLTYFWFKCSSSHIFSCCWSTFALFSFSSACSCSLSVTSFWMLASRVNGSIAGSDLQRWMSSSCTHQHISVLHASSSKHSSHSLYLPYVPKTLVTDFTVMLCLSLSVWLPTNTMILSISQKKSCHRSLESSVTAYLEVLSKSLLAGTKKNQ